MAHQKAPLKSWTLLGVADHQGVVNVLGRLGAALGPDAFRRVFARFSGADGVLESMTEAGNIKGLAGDVARNHQLASEGVKRAHLASGLSVVVGGGHDHGYSHLKGLKDVLGPKKKLGCINIDAHLDVRKPSPLITSGSPFYLAIESGVIESKNLIEFGIQSHCNSPALWDYVAKRKVPVVPFEGMRHGEAVRAFAQALRKLRKSCDAIAISLDLDAASAVFAPGVSAPQAEGFTSSDMIEMMELAGNEKKVISLGIFELNPLHDIDDRTARLAATSAYHFISHALKR